MSPENLALWLSYALLVAAPLMSTTRSMRLLIAAAGAAGLVHAVMIADHAGLGWMLALITACGVKLRMAHLDGRRIRFTPIEDALRRTYLGALPRRTAREFIDQGVWLRGLEDDVLTNEGEPSTNLYYLVSGEACVTRKGRDVGIRRVGDMIGEATILSDADATETVTLTEPSTFWCASTPTLRQFLDDREGSRAALLRSFPRPTHPAEPEPQPPVSGTGRADTNARGQAAASL